MKGSRNSWNGIDAIMAFSTNKRIAVFFTYGVSLETWEKRGMFSREVKFYEELAREIGEIWFFTYGHDDARFASHLDSRIKIFPKRLPIPNLLYAFLIPFFHWNELTHVHAIRIHQVAGAIPALLTHWLLRKPIIVRAGFQWYTFARRQGASRLKLWLISLLEALTYRSAHVIIHTTQQDADFIAKRYRVNTSKLHVIPNWVDTDLFKPIGAVKQPRTVCFVGRFEEQKNLPALMEAMRDVNAKLVLYGEGSQRTQLEDAAREHDVDVEFRGRIVNEEIPLALNACEVFVLPSLYEGNPKVLLEAMACGLPVVGTDVEGIVSIIEHEKTGLVCKTNPDSIRQAINRLLDNPELRSRFGEAARKSILVSSSLLRAIQTEATLYL